MMTSKEDDSVPKIVDFGLSAVIGPGRGVVEQVGTITYAAPEIFLGTPYDQSADIWSLGNVIHVLLVGHLPFDAQDKEEIVRNILKKTFSTSGAYFNSVSEEAKDLLNKIFVRKRRERIKMVQIIEHPWITKLDLDSSSLTLAP